ncbi:MAG: T9SS type A sorting domain-containing protein, partial [Candidatus Kryptoniota bacterium]
MKESRSHGDVANDFWGYAQSVVDYSSGNWKPAWPLPEYTSGDLKYSAPLRTTDGKLYYGDPFWFTDSVTAVKQQPTQVASKFGLSNNYPNPFNPTTQISFTVDRNGPTSLKIYNTLGQLVMTVFDGNAAQHQNYSFNVGMDRFASGVYFYTLRDAGNSITKKMVLLK